MARRMSTSPPTTGRQTPSSSGSGLVRGRACGPCRKRKVRCDGEKPVCGQCQRSSRSNDPCNYADVGPSKTQILEATISRLQTRIQELEDPNPEVALVNPYATPSSPAAGSSRSSPSVVATPDVREEDLSPSSVQILLAAFRPHAEEFGFFLDFGRVQDNITSPLTDRPLPMLRNAIYLWGAHFAGQRWAEHEARFSESAVHSAQPISFASPGVLLESIQAKILLSTYFFRQNRCLEAISFLAAATGMSLAMGLHKDSQGASPTAGFLSQSFKLPPAMDFIEEGERIRGFWTVFMQCNATSVIGEFVSPMAADNGLQVDVPWPLESAAYAEPNFIFMTNTGQTLRNFRPALLERGLREYTPMALVAQASFLYERAASLATQYRPNMTADDTETYASTFSTHDYFLERFRTSIPRPDRFHSTAIRAYLTAHSFANAGLIRLHGVFAETSGPSWMKCVTAAHAVISVFGAVNVQTLPPMSPLMATVLATVFRVLKWTLGRLALGAVGISVSPQDIQTDLDRCTLLMTLPSFASPLMEAQYQLVVAAEGVLF
ncbi:hypothetical protein EV121DRAFT_290605 [Schizophyllum commune]